jgi:phospholipase/lecithinase/hemolysin
VKRALGFAIGIGLFAFTAISASAAFTSLYVFGDGICTTTSNTPPDPKYYGLRRTNGRTWIEVLAERQGLNYESNKNWSYYGHYSANLLTNLSSFAAPADANSALFVVWVNDADFVDHMTKVYYPYGTNLMRWTTAINQSLTNHFKAVTNLYSKGARTLILPSAVDITKIPQYNMNPAPDRAFIRQRIIDFNTAFTTTWLNQVTSSCPNLKIYFPNLFTLVDNVLASPALYGLSNAFQYGVITCVLEDDSLNDKSLNGPGAYYTFWTTSDPTAKFHAQIADYVHQLISPVRIGGIAALGNSNQLEIVSIPVGRNGFVQVRTNVLQNNWADLAGFNSTSTNQSVLVPSSGPQQFYRLRFPFSWVWP